VLQNGDFEAGFDITGIAYDWKGFHNAINGTYGWSDETYPGLVWNGNSAQSMAILSSQTPDAYIGIYQTAGVIKGKAYNLVFHGLIRSTEGSPLKSSWGYRVQVGIDPKGGRDWRAVETWTDVGWDDEPLNLPQYVFNEYQTKIVPTGPSLTLFIRGWRKWITPNTEGQFIIYGVHLIGPIPSKVTSTGRLPGTGGDLPADYAPVWSPGAAQSGPH
jgi:hypothetical protein